MTIEPQSPGLGTERQPQPFSEAPKDPPGGCSRPLLVGCSITLVLAGLLLLVLLWKAQDWMPSLFRWSLTQFEQQISANLPPEMSEAERQRLSEAFDAAAGAVEDGTADPAALQRLQGRLLEVARGGRLSREEVLGLTEALEEVAGGGESPAEPGPDPEVGEEEMPVAFLGPAPDGQRSRRPPLAA